MLTKVIFRVYLIQFLHRNELAVGVYLVSKFAYRAWNWSLFPHNTPCCSISMSKTTKYGIRNGIKLYLWTWPINVSRRFPIFVNMWPIYRFKELYWWYKLELRRDTCMFMLKKYSVFCNSRNDELHKRTTKMIFRSHYRL